MFKTKLKVKYIKGTNPKRYVLKSGLVFNDTVVMAGFETDFASVPKCLQWLYTPQGKYSRASVLHDYLYSKKDINRHKADAIFYDAMKADKVNFFTRHLFYITVSIFGKGRKK